MKDGIHAGASNCSTEILQLPGSLQHSAAETCAWCTDTMEEEKAPHISQDTIANRAGHVKKENSGSAVAASQHDRPQGSPEQHEHLDHGSNKRSAEAAAIKTPAKRAKKRSQGSSPAAKKSGPMDSFLIKNPL